GLLQRIPVEQHNILAVVTTIGIEINVQDIWRMEEDYLVLRGRMAGTTDMGRVFFIPFSQINYLGFQKEVKEAQLRAMYGEGPPVEAVEVKPEAVATVSAEPEPPPADAVPVPPPPPPPEANPPTEPPKSAPQLKVPRKSGVLERLRARAQLGRSTTPPAKP